MSDEELKRQFAETVGRVGGGWQAQQRAIAEERQAAINLFTEMIAIGMPALPAVCRRIVISSDGKPNVTKIQHYSERGVHLAGSGPNALAGAEGTEGRDLFLLESGDLLFAVYATGPTGGRSWVAIADIISAEEAVDEFTPEGLRKEIIPALVKAVNQQDTGGRAETTARALGMSEGMLALSLLAHTLGEQFGRALVKKKPLPPGSSVRKRGAK